MKEYQIDIIEIHATYAEEKAGRVRLFSSSGLLNVEDYVGKIFKDKEYTVLHGADIHLFLWFCCGKFDDVTGLNWGGEPFVKLNHQNGTICMDQIHSRWEDLLNNAFEMWTAYYQNYPPKQKLAASLSESVKIFDPSEIISLLTIYSLAEYDPRGAADLFVFNKKTRDRKFVEVKSYTDSLRYEQLKLASQLINKMGRYFSIAYVLPDNYDELMKDKTIEVSSDLVAKHLHKLLAIGPTKVYDGFESADDKSAFATNDCGVNLNCLLFFINKVRGTNLPYDVRRLDFGGSLFSMDQYLAWLESAWSKIGPAKLKSINGGRRS